MSKRITAILGLTAVGLLAGTAYVQAATKPAEITCQEFLAMGEEYQPHIVYWLDGYKHGKLTTEAVEMEMFKHPVVQIVDECKAAPEKTVAAVVEGWNRE